MPYQPLGQNPVPAPARVSQKSFWRKVGGGSLSISLILHVLLLIAGLFWIFQFIPEKKEDVDFMPKGGGGGQPGAKVDVAMRKRATMTSMTAPRLAAKGASSSFTLPEPDSATAMTSLGALSSGGLSGGLGGSGSGGGRGDGKGKGFGSGTGPGLGGGAGMNPFGMLTPNSNGLIGVFYDTKQDARRKPTSTTRGNIVGIIKDFTVDWNERKLSKNFYEAAQKTYQTRIYIPVMSADEAPKAFKCEKEVKTGLWIAVYRGTVSPPKTGKYRFVGAADDVLVVRFNRQAVLNYGFASGTDGNVKNGQPVMANPPAIYPYSTTPMWNHYIKGLSCGATFEAKAGVSYPIEILISEIPGGYFGAMLMIEEVGETYKKDSSGSPILPIFRLDSSLPPAGTPESPPFDPNGPVWKLVGGRGKLDI